MSLFKRIRKKHRISMQMRCAIGDRLTEAIVLGGNKKENDQVVCPQAGKLVRKNIAVDSLFTNVL